MNLTKVKNAVKIYTTSDKVRDILQDFYQEESIQYSDKSEDSFLHIQDMKYENNLFGLVLTLGKGLQEQLAYCSEEQLPKVVSFLHRYYQNKGNLQVGEDKDLIAATRGVLKKCVSITFPENYSHELPLNHGLTRCKGHGLIFCKLRSVANLSKYMFEIEDSCEDVLTQVLYATAEATEEEFVEVLIFEQE